MTEKHLSIFDFQPLPTPAERPDAEVVIYDGECRFCRGQVERLARWDRQGRLAFLSLHDSSVAKQYPDLTREQLLKEMVLVDRRGKRHGGAAAFRVLSRRLPRLWLLVPWLHIPGSLPLWQWGYQKVAQRRYRISGKTCCDEEACEAHLKKR